MNVHLHAFRLHLLARLRPQEREIMIMPSFSNPNGEGGAMPNVETLDPFLARVPSLIGFSSSPFPNKHQISSV